MWLTVCILFGSAAGGMARFWVSGLVGRRVGETFPWGTLVVNVTGSWLIGLLAAFFSALPAQGPTLAWAGLAVGFLGSYTTVSSFSLQTLLLARDWQWAAAAGNVLLSVLLCLGSVAGGFETGRWLAGG